MPQLDIFTFSIQIGLLFWFSWSLILVISKLILPNYLIFAQSKNKFWDNIINILLIYKMYFFLLKFFCINFFNKHLKVASIFLKKIDSFFFLKNVNNFFFFKLFNYYNFTFFSRFVIVPKIKKIMSNFLLFKKKDCKFLSKFLDLNSNFKEIKIIFVKRKFRYKSFFDNVVLLKDLVEVRKNIK